MTLRKHYLATAVALAAVGAAIPSAHAQTLTITGSVTSTATNGLYTYTYAVTPGGMSPGGAAFNVNLLIFNFSDPNETFLSAVNPAGGNPSLGLTSQIPGTGVFTFDSGTLTAGVTENFSFTSPDASTGGGTVGATGVSYNGSGVAAVNNVSPAPAPEPGTLASVAVLSTCLGLGIVARKRKALVA